MEIGSEGEPSYAIRASASTQGVGSSPLAFISQDDTPQSFTDIGQGQRIRTTDEPSETLRATKRGPYSDYYADQSTIVRRLTPLECERLQGYPDGWTDNGQADSARYRQLGNSVAVPCVEWIARRLINIDNQQQRNGEIHA